MSLQQPPETGAARLHLADQALSMRVQRAFHPQKPGQHHSAAQSLGIPADYRAENPAECPAECPAENGAHCPEPLPDLMSAVLPAALSPAAVGGPAGRRKWPEHVPAGVEWP